MHEATTPYTQPQWKMIEKGVGRIYDVFRDRVATGRNLTPDGVDDIGQGRVFRGDQARHHSLVDSMGGLEQALQTARKLAHLPDNASLVDVSPGKRWVPAPTAADASLMLYGAETVALLGREGASTLCPILWDEPG